MQLKVRFESHPVDLYLCICVAAVVAIAILLDLTGPMRVALGVPFAIFIPGYVFTFALFPERARRSKGIGWMERVALSLGISMAIMPLIGLAMNYTPWGMSLMAILVSLVVFVSTVACYAGYRWRKLSVDRRHVVELEIPREVLGRTPVDKALTVISVALMIGAIGALIWAIMTPRMGDMFTEFYVLDESGKPDAYPTNLTVNRTAKVILGLENHEYENLTYHIEVWLLNQTWEEDRNITVYNWGILIDQFNISLPHNVVRLEGPHRPQWETNYTFAVPETGVYKLSFLLFKREPEEVPHGPNQRLEGRIIQPRVESAYRKVHFWVHVSS